MRADYDVAIVGGGFFGCCIALYLRSVADRIVILERSQELMTRASAINQARVHAGFHYPRSFATALRSFANQDRFREVFANAIVDNFDMLYAIARRGSKITAKRFALMFQAMGAPVGLAPEHHRALFDPETIEGVFHCQEFAFDWKILRDELAGRLDRAGIEIRCGIEALEAGPVDGGVGLALSDGSHIAARKAVNATYGQINALPKRSGMAPFSTKYELAEIALAEPPSEFKGLGVTVMDGPFFSFMPFPAERLYSFTHVRYTPHFAWTDNVSPKPTYETAEGLPKATRWRHMVADAKRYMPCLERMVWRQSLYEVKALMARNEIDDGRPILYHPHAECPGLISVLGGKIDNIFDLFEVISTSEPCWSQADSRHFE